MLYVPTWVVVVFFGRETETVCERRTYTLLALPEVGVAHGEKGGVGEGEKGKREEEESQRGKEEE